MWSYGKLLYETVVTFTSSKLFVTQSPPSPLTLFSVCDVLLIAEEAAWGFKLSFQKKETLEWKSKTVDTGDGIATQFHSPHRF